MAYIICLLNGWAISNRVRVWHTYHQSNTNMNLSCALTQFNDISTAILKTFQHCRRLIQAWVSGSRECDEYTLAYKFTFSSFLTSSILLLPSILAFANVALIALAIVVSNYCQLTHRVRKVVEGKEDPRV